MDHRKWRPSVPTGEAIIVRYANDIVVGLQASRDAAVGALLQTSLRVALLFLMGLMVSALVLADGVRLEAISRRWWRETLPETRPWRWSGAS